ncbi:MAG: DUF1127 domain-containing protein [Pseudomonadota bacterium]
MISARMDATASFRAPTAFAAARTALRNHLAYRRTVAELDGLSTKTLEDLGLNRAGIKAEARRAVYGR